jgi:hypothetical protein
MNKKSAQTAKTPQGPTTQRPKFHGVLRGLDATPRSTVFEGKFGRMFRSLPAAVFPEADLDKLAEKMIAEAETDDAGNPTAEIETVIDAEENQGTENVPAIPAGFTYLGQFIDHDITFDPVSSLVKQNDPDQLTDFRTPRFDLDSVYGRGPGDQPYLYEDDGKHFKLGRKLTGVEASFDGNIRDLPRHQSSSGTARALIGDPRNDENVIVAQLHSTMLRFHNSLVDLWPTRSFEEIQQSVRWHYQWVVLNDFLPKMVGWDTIYSILPHLNPRTPKSPTTNKPQTIYEAKPDLRFFHWKNEPFIPVEFSVAAYRFGHSMIRPVYRLNKTFGVNPPTKADPINGRQFIFTPTDTNQGLNGFREIPENFAIDWRLFFDMNVKGQPKKGVERIQPAYKVDSSLVNPLALLPEFVKQNLPFTSLAQRNLRRGLTMGLPSGQDVACFMGIEPLKDSQLKVGKATREDSPGNMTIDQVSPSFAGKAPLWFYILSEAQQAYNNPRTKDDTSTRLGEVGGRIVAEVFIGLLLGDSHSFLSQAPCWTPELKNSKGKFGMAELIKQAITA